MSRGEAGGNNSLRTAIFTDSLALAACCEDGTLVKKVGTQDPWYDQAFHNDNVKASPPASHLQRQRPLAAKAHSSPVAEQDGASGGF
ncbi:hypothetical protein T09_15413 [Trichinella sp. T9]|nr:hypothetical protein T09_15413 [Trichinella sp. T9]